MADTIAITPGSGATVATDDRGAIGHVQRVVDQGGAAVTTGQVTPTTTAATLVAARDTRKEVTVVNHSDKDVFVGPATVTTGNGVKLVPGAGWTFPTTALLQSIIASGTATGGVHYAEVYDS